MATTQRSRTRSKGFPWGLALVGLGAYLWYQHEQAAAAATPGAAPLPPSTGPVNQPVTTATSTALQAASPFAGTTEYQTAHTWAVREGQPQVLAWLDTIPADDLSKFAYVTQMWSDKSYCVDQKCFDYWHAIKTKYPTVFAYKNYW